MDVATLVGVLLPFAPCLYWLMDLAKDITNRSINGIVTKLTALAVGFTFLQIVAHVTVRFTADGGVKQVANPLANLGWGELLYIAIIIASLAGAGHDWLRARNSNDPMVKSKLIP